MKILLIGATGQLGGDLLRNNPGHEIIAPDRHALDLTVPAGVLAQVESASPDVVVNCAAFHNVPLCETESAQAFKVNCVGVRDLAAACSKAGAWLVTFSTDYVFGGSRTTPWREDDLPAPMQIYGISRLAGEHAATAVAPDKAVIIRTCGLYGRNGARSKGGNFVDGRVADLCAGKQINMASEQIVCPTSTEHLSRAVLELIVHKGLSPGIFHLVNEGACSWYEFTLEIARIIGVRCEINPVDLGGKTGTFRRPLYSVLENTRARAIGITLPLWKDALAEYLRMKYPNLGVDARC